MQVTTDVFDEWADAMRQKFNEALKKDNKRSSEPWKDYPIEYLYLRLHDEIKEFEDVELGSDDSARECVDIAEFAMFIYQKIKTRSFYDEVK